MNTRPCVRCGARPRVDLAFVCSACATDRTMRREMIEARNMGGRDYKAQRAWLQANMGWYGGWPAERPY